MVVSPHECWFQLRPADAPRSCHLGCQRLYSSTSFEPATAMLPLEVVGTLLASVRDRERDSRARTARTPAKGTQGPITSDDRRLAECAADWTLRSALRRIHLSCAAARRLAACRRAGGGGLRR